MDKNIQVRSYAVGNCWTVRFVKFGGTQGLMSKYVGLRILFHVVCSFQYLTPVAEAGDVCTYTPSKSK